MAQRSTKKSSSKKKRSAPKPPTSTKTTKQAVRKTRSLSTTAKRGSKVVSTKRATLTRTCEYSVTFSFRTRAASRLRFQAKFGGNEVLSTVSSRTRTARLC